VRSRAAGLPGNNIGELLYNLQANSWFIFVVRVMESGSLYGDTRFNPENRQKALELLAASAVLFFLAYWWKDDHIILAAIAFLAGVFVLLGILVVLFERAQAKLLPLLVPLGLAVLVTVGRQVIPAIWSPKPVPLEPSTGRNTPQGEKENGFDLPGFLPFARPTHFYSPGVIYGVDREGNSYVLADITRETTLEVAKPSQLRTIKRQFSSVPTANGTQYFAAEDRGDFIGQAIRAIRKAAEIRNQRISEIFAEENIQERDASEAEVNKAFTSTPFWKERAPDLRELRLFTVLGTALVVSARLSFTQPDPEVLRAAVNELTEQGVVAKTYEGTIEVVPASPVAIAFKPLELRPPTAARPDSRFITNSPWLLPASITSAAAQTNLVASPHSSPRVFALPQTHFAEGNDLASFGARATYGQVVEQIKTKLLGPGGFGEVRYYDSGVGLAIATRFEVTETNGVSLKAPARFEPRKATAKRVRGFYITVTPDPRPAAWVSTKRPAELFSLRYGMPYLPDDLARIPLDHGTRVNVFVLEFNDQAGTYSLIGAGDCPGSAQEHLIQAGILPK